MIAGGNATVIVANMDRSVDFYTRILGLALKNRYGNDWAEISAGGTLTIGLHPEGRGKKAGERGAISIGFLLDVAIEDAVAKLEKQGVRFDGPIIDNSKTEGIKLAGFSDPDGNPLYLCQVVGWG